MQIMFQEIQSLKNKVAIHLLEFYFSEKSLSKNSKRCPYFGVEVEVFFDLCKYLSSRVTADHVIVKIMAIASNN